MLLSLITNECPGFRLLSCVGAYAPAKKMLLDPLAAMVEAAPGDRVLPTLPGTTNTPAHAVVEAGLIGIDSESERALHAPRLHPSAVDAQ